MMHRRNSASRERLGQRWVKIGIAWCVSSTWAASALSDRDQAGAALLLLGCRPVQHGAVGSDGTKSITSSSAIL